MSSRIEQLIDEIEDYVENCKYQPLSKTNIIVNKEEFDELLSELRRKTPEEIKFYEQIVQNKESILNDARKKAEEIVSKATAKTNELLNEHEIMQQAYAQANEVVTLASVQAKGILDDATNEANELRAAAMSYLDEMLENMEKLMTTTLNTTAAHYESFYGAISSYNDVIKAHRAEVNPVVNMLDNASSDSDGDDNLDII